MVETTSNINIAELLSTENAVRQRAEANINDEFSKNPAGLARVLLQGLSKEEDEAKATMSCILLKKYYLDEFAGGVGSGNIATKSGGGGMSLLAVLLPILVVALAFAAKMLTA